MSTLYTERVKINKTLTFKAKAFKKARNDGEEIDGLNDWNIRWVGTEGYKGIVARQLQEFKRTQKERAMKEHK